MTFEQLDRSIDADSDSDDELAEQAHMYRSMLYTFMHATHTCILVLPFLTVPSHLPFYLYKIPSNQLCHSDD